MEIGKAKRADLDYILGWLEEEYAKNGEGFWCNENVIRAIFTHRRLWVLRVDGLAIGFLAGPYAILCVKETEQGKGYGKALAQRMLSIAKRQKKRSLTIECSPERSLDFWRHMGFKYHNIGGSKYAHIVLV